MEDPKCRVIITKPTLPLGGPKPFLVRVVGSQSSFVTILALWNTMIATSVLSLPWAVKEAGLLCSVLCLVITGAIMGYTCYIVLTSVNNMPDGQMLEFHDVCGRRLGPQAKVLAITGSLLTLLGGMLVYWILLANFLFHIGNFVHDHIYDVSASNVTNQHESAVCRFQNLSDFCATDRDDQNITRGSTEFQHWWSETKTIPLYLLLLLFPLLNFKSPTIFTKMNSVGMLSLFYLIVFVAVKAFGWGINVKLKFSSEASHDHHLYSHSAKPFRLTFPALTGVAALGYFVQNSVLSIVRNQKHPQHNVRDMVLAYVLVLLTYLYFGGLFFITFPFNKNCIADNLLDNIVSNDVLGLVARCALFFQLTCLFPQLAFITRIQLFTALCGTPWPSVFHVVGLNVVLVTVCVVFAVFLPHIGRIISFVGALCGFYYAVGLPSLVRCVSLREEGRLTSFHVIFHALLVLLALANFVAQFFVIKEL